MSSAFTSPADASWQTMLDEITLAYSERRQSIGQSVYTPTDDKDVQAVVYWTALQDWIEANCVSFIDHVSGPVNPGETGFLYFTLATWRSAATLNASGFRRVPEGVEWDGIVDPVWSYGQMQAGDIIGPWIFEDIQKGFSALIWSARTRGTTTSLLRKEGQSGTKPSLAKAKNEATSLYISYGPAGNPNAPEAYTNIYQQGSDYSALMVRERRVDSFSLSPLDADTVSFFLSSAFSIGEYDNQDDDSLEDGVFKEIFNKSYTAGVEFDSFGTWDIVPRWPTPVDGVVVFRGYLTTFDGQLGGYLIKWNFTNA